MKVSGANYEVMRELKIPKCALNGVLLFECKTPCAALRAACYFNSFLDFIFQRSRENPDSTLVFQGESFRWFPVFFTPIDVLVNGIAEGVFYL